MATLKPALEDDRQRRVDARHKGLNGIDYIEVGDDPRKLRVVFFLDAPDALEASHCTIEGGERVRAIRVLSVRESAGDHEPEPRSATLTLDRAGDFSTYTLVIRGVAGFDPHYLRCGFSFWVSEPKELDCVSAPVSVIAARAEPEIDYLSKDYASFRQLIVNRLGLIMPEWSESHEPDEGIALVEILAYVGDYLSYYQDAVATEAYLGTARRRLSVRRHARLLDYAMHEGCNARTWICIDSSADLPPLAAADCRFVTDCHSLLPDPSPVLSPAALENVPADAYQAFAPADSAPLLVRAAHSLISFYAWGASQYVLPPGATAATLVDGWQDSGAVKPKPGDPTVNTGDPGSQPGQAAQNGKGVTGEAGQHVFAHPREESHGNAPKPPQRMRKLAHLKPGAFLFIEEVCSPITGLEEDADPAHRQVVRLTHVNPTIDPLYEQPVVNVEWEPADALTFALVVAAIGPAPECRYLGPRRAYAVSRDIMVARANVWLIDAGTYVEEDVEDQVPAIVILQGCEDFGEPAQADIVPGRFGPALQRSALTFRVPPGASLPASALLAQDPREAGPQVVVSSIPGLPDGSGALFSFDDLAAPQALLTRLKNRDPATSALLDRLSHATRAAIRKYDGATPPPALVQLLQAQLAAIVTPWSVQPDLLSSGPDDRDYVVDIDDDGRAQLRFGDGQNGMQPTAGTAFRIAYRVGTGPQGNVGAETIIHLQCRTIAALPTIRRVWNPFPAVGGTAPQTLDDVRTNAPTAFLDTIERAVTADDYATLAMRAPQVRRAAASLRWTGTGYAARVAIAPYGGEQVAIAMLNDVARFLERYRRVGHMLEVCAATYVSLDIELEVHIAPDYLRGHVEAALLDAFGTGPARRAGLGLFAPDNLGFGEDVYLSRIVAAAQAVEGVVRVVVMRFERMFVPSHDALRSGVLPLASQEIARLDNDPNFPEHGRIRFRMRGGR
ncbi:putative baseplate assembly protein [Paraburkholderia sp. UCT31]|uniref:putative baseplate assembly protein n=1 Tax=Paraburkholderia sp. UCT31 TaxID=2615209 RepID=UPI0016556BEC|nr:putative baseplate assembly protein [Paraburkholderia sp. UCT31]MBC8737663.1 putative baseplate assembly protein [Paraburkholderia sp. UCT31]